MHLWLLSLTDLAEKTMRPITLQDALIDDDFSL